MRLSRIFPRHRRKRLLRPRVLVYLGLLTVIVAGFIVALAVRTTLRVDVIRDRGVLGREVAGGVIENVYSLQIMNIGRFPLEIQLEASGLPGVSIRTVEAGSLNVEPASNRKVPVVVRMHAAQTTSGLHDIELHVTGRSSGGHEARVTERTSFYVPQ